jgi:hypothetical protein
MKKKVIILLVLATMLMTGCSPYKGNISMGSNKEKATDSSKMTKEEVNEQAMNSVENEVKEKFGEEAAQIVGENREAIMSGAEQIAEGLAGSKEIKVRDLSEYNGVKISGWELRAFIDKYKGNPDIAIIVNTGAFGGTHAYKGEDYVGKVGYNNLPIITIWDESGMVWYAGINYNAQYQGRIITNGEGTEYLDAEGFAKDANGKVKMYENFEDAGIDPSYTEYIEGKSSFYTIPIKNKKGEITGIFFEESVLQQ